MRCATIFFSHLFDAETLVALDQLRHQSPGYATPYVLTDRPDLVPSHLLPHVHTLDFPGLKREFPHALGNTVVPGNCHLALIDFVRHHHNFDYYWVIEYDVRFTGNWAVFFAAFAEDDADLLACHIRRRHDEPDWNWWPTLVGPQGQPAPMKHSARAFLPVQRISRRAVTEVWAQAALGWRGHFECLVPTVLLMAGLRLADIGGTGEFTPAHRRHRFYSSLTSADGTLSEGTMRWRPPHDDTPRHRDMLYHPVKPNAAWAWPTSGSELQTGQHHDPEFGVVVHGAADASRPVPLAFTPP
jgi:hypothetical protein